jgi:hypothetical protein
MINLWGFEETPKHMASKDMLNLKQRLGGSVGRLVAGMDRTDALRVADNVYVTSKAPQRSLEALMNLGGSDVHVADHPAEIQLIADRLRAFNGQAVQPGHQGKAVPPRRI